ncbi:cellulase family glycosylhydrolase [Spirosoma sp. RP8]|uniref:Cellulase family glycosylhydrolase n=1 Tax=Spirosoma liriopis TaxID=2937440 RepID=A0ABT0HNI0_9BACT|nr:cellulase family glycosylhydrolase [Spirosoma liriopis]MCK8493729.1 cellulase family glycosylhydrolase [Spirosoma liriopis]
MTRLRTLSTAWLLLLTTKILAQTSGTFQLHPQNPHYFAYQNKPMILVGSGEHYGSVINLDFDYKAYLRATAGDGMNTTRLFTGAYVEKLGDFGIMKNTLAPAEGRLLLPWQRSPNTTGYALGGNRFDLTQWDDAYFARLADFVAEAQKHGVIVEVNLFSAHYADGWNYSAFNPKNNVNQTDSVAASLVNTLQNGSILGYQERYVRRIVRTLNRFPNIYFEIQNEPWANQTDIVLRSNEYGPDNDWRSTLQVVSQRSNDWQRQVARWIKDEERQLTNKHLISQDISNFHYPVADADPNVSIFTFHYALPIAVTENYHLGKVIGFNETGFAGRADSTFRRQAWRFLMAGGGLFNQLDYSYSVGSEMGQDTTYKAPGGGSPALRAQFKVLKDFFDKLPFVQLRPDHALVTASPGAMTQTLSDGRTQWILYYESMSAKPYDLTLNLPKGSYQVAWMDALTGKSIGQTTLANGQLTVPAGRTDKVAIIKVADRN